MSISYPLPREISAIGKASGLEYPDTVRDIVRLVAIAHLRSKNFLNEDCVLVGGMALRLRGSNRFTIFDTDSSARRGPIDEKDISDSIHLTTEELEMTPEDPAYWTNSKQLRTAQPIKYKAYFAGSATTPVEDECSLTVNERGLKMPAQWFDLRTPYPSLTFDPMPQIPVMHLIEQTAEKILAWCGNSLAKHYLDLGWIAGELADELDGQTLRAQCEEKLETNRRLFSDFQRFGGVEDLIDPLREPDRYFGPLNREKNRREQDIRFLGNRMSLEDAKGHVRRTIVPLLSS